VPKADISRIIRLRRRRGHAVMASAFERRRQSNLLAWQLTAVAPNWVENKKLGGVS
jgi:hypothetical protein